MLGRIQAVDDRFARWRRRVWMAVHTARTDRDFGTTGRGCAGDSANLARHGWHAVREGRIDLARRWFQSALHHDPYAVTAWLGLSRVAVNRSERRAYLQAALDIQFLLSDMGRRR